MVAGALRRADRPAAIGTIQRLLYRCTATPRTKITGTAAIRAPCSWLGCTWWQVCVVGVSWGDSKGAGLVVELQVGGGSTGPLGGGRNRDAPEGGGAEGVCDDACVAGDAVATPAIGGGG